MTHPTIEELARRAADLLSRHKERASSLKPRERLAISPQEMPSQDPLERRRNMDEVALGYSAEQAQVEAMRCLQCRNAPCVEGCPVRIDIPGFIRHVAAGEFGQAIAVIKRNSLLPAICGRVCPQEVQCQAPCTVGKMLGSALRAVGIGRLERFVADWEREQGAIRPPEVKPDTGHRVAVIGSGPASITAAADLRREGHRVTIFEAFHRLGGVMVYGIPEFRLPKRIVQAEVETLRAMGVEIRTDFVVGRTRRLQDLLTLDGYEAAFLGCGAGLPKFLEIEGENLVGVFSANEYLTRANLMRAYDVGRADTPIFRPRRVAVIGGGNVAMDAARMAVRLGSEEVTVVYRRTEAEMPARVEEVAHAKEEGIRFCLLTSPQRILGNGRGYVAGLECLRYTLGDPDESGRRRPVPVPGSEFRMDVEAVIVAIGNEPNPLLRQTTEGLVTDAHGRIQVDGRGRTSLPGVYAGGDVVLGAATVILAMGEGRRAAAAIHEDLLAGQERHGS